ncbi:MAG: type II secretion system protein GspD [Gammaproteobacteria bacterium SG8_47]|nr:MAG: type II secretion system protein GspD [Gammaproteobacteria bacterium SG8_47]
MLAWACAGYAAEKVTLNFKDTDLTAVIGAVSEMTGENFIVDPRVKGKVTVISSQPMNADEVYQVFLSVLKVHGFSAIPGENATKIVPAVNAKQEEVPLVSSRSPGRGDEVVTRVITIENVDAAQLVPILRPLVPQPGHLAAYPASNMLIVSDTAANIERLVQIINRVDRATYEDVEVIPLQHASATELVRILTALNQGDPKTSARQRPAIVADERTNSILLGGDRASRLRLRAIITHLDTPVDVGGDTQVIYLRYANAADLAPVLTGVGQSLDTQQKGQKAPAAAVAGGKITIQADESTNALVINAPPDVFRSLRAVIQQLDIRRAQVLVEAVLAEVSSDKANELGVQWAFGGDAENAVGLVNFNKSPILGIIGGVASGGVAIPSIEGLGLAVGDINDNGYSWAAFVRALAGTSYTNILATPSLVTLDNQEAKIVVGQNVPFLTGSFTNTGAASGSVNPFQTIERQDVGLTLKVKPQINEGNSIKLEVETEASSIAQASVAAADLVTNTRTITTAVLVESGQVVVLGGLIRDDLIESEQKVPGLGDIPVLGALFRYSTTQTIKTNLMVFLHPTILRDQALLTRSTGEKYNYMRAEQMAARERGVRLMNDDVVPVLPDFEDVLVLPPPFESSTEAGESPAASTQGQAEAASVE